VQAVDRCDSTVVDDMSIIGQQLASLRSSVDAADPSRGVGLMMNCAWFGEIILAFPRVETIRIGLAPADDKTSLAGSLRHLNTHIDLHLTAAIRLSVCLSVP